MLSVFNRFYWSKFSFDVDFIANSKLEKGDKFFCRVLGQVSLHPAVWIGTCTARSAAFGRVPILTFLERGSLRHRLSSPRSSTSSSTQTTRRNLSHPSWSISTALPGSEPGPKNPHHTYRLSPPPDSLGESRFWLS